MRLGPRPRGAADLRVGLRKVEHTVEINWRVKAESLLSYAICAAEGPVV